MGGQSDEGKFLSLCETTVGQRNYFTLFFRTSRQFHIIISGINNGLFNASCDLEGI